MLLVRSNVPWETVRAGCVPSTFMAMLSPLKFNVPTGPVIVAGLAVPLAVSVAPLPKL